MIHLRHLLCPAHTYSTPRQGTSLWDRVYCCPTSTRAASWLAWSLATLSLILCIAAIALYIATLLVQPPTPSSWGTGDLSAVLYVYLPFLAFPLVGALIASRRPENPVGWICLLIGIL
jgi:hypothetical protein